MNYDAQKFYNAELILNNASDLLSELDTVLEDMEGTGFWPWTTDFVYEDELEGILDDIFAARSECTSICNVVTECFNVLCGRDADFAAEYAICANSSFSQMSSYEQEKNENLINYTNEEAARELNKHSKNAHKVEMSDMALDIHFRFNKEGYSKLSVEEQQKQMQYFKAEVIEYKNMDLLKKAGVNTVAFLGGAVEGLVNVGENIVDGGYMLVGGGWSYLQEAVYDVDGALETRKSVRNFVNKDFSGNMYNSFAEWTDLNSYAMNGNARTAGNVTGQAIGEVGIQFLGGGAYKTAVMVAVHGLKGMGSSAEEVLIDPNTSFGEAYGYSLANGSIEAASSYVLYGKTKGSAKVLDKVNSSKINLLGKTTFNNNHGKVLTRSVIAASKEYAKEATNLAIDKDYDFWNATNNASIGVGTQFLNELVVSPNVNKLINKSEVSAKAKEIAKTKTKIEKTLEQKNHQIEVKNAQLERHAIINETLSESKSVLEGELSGISISSTKVTSSMYSRIDEGLTNSINDLEGRNKMCEALLKSYKLKPAEKLVDNDYINKVAKKIGGSYFKSNVNDIMDDLKSE